MEKIDLSAYLKENVVVDHLKFRDMPWVDKSKWRKHKWCPKAFELKTMEEMTGKLVTRDFDFGHDAMEMGSDAHLVFSHFFKAIVDNDLIARFMEVPIEHEFKKSRLYYTFLDICNQILPENLRSDPYRQRIISNFCEYQKDYWNQLSQQFNHKKWAFKKFFIPIYQELYLENFDMMIYGTLDAMYHNPLYGTNTDWGDKKYTIIDYKGGNVPKGVKEGESSTDMKSADRQEMHVYAWLVAHAQKQVKDVDPVTMEEVIRNVKVFPDIEEYTDVIANMLFLGDDKPYYLPPMLMQNRSLEAIFKEIRRMRETWTAGGKYAMVKMESAPYKCPACEYVNHCNSIRLKEAFN